MSTPLQSTPPPEPSSLRRVNLALQGGGSHGAFTWGVLDALLEDERIQFDGISGASAGAVNAVALAHGFATAQGDGPEKANPRAAARASLSRIWHGVAAMGSLGSMADSISKMLIGGWATNRVSANLMAGAMTQWMSPYQSNPLDINPLRKLLQAEIDFHAIAGMQTTKAFVSA